jgi:hypothetical protein
MTKTHGGSGSGYYARCATCGHPNHRHDRIVKQPDGRRLFVGCEVRWPRSGAVRGPSNPCQCQAFKARDKEATR